MSVVTFTLRSPVTQAAAPFTLGHGFKKGDVPTSFVTDLSDYQVIVRRRWSDGSVKHAVISGTTAITGGVDKIVTINLGTPPTGTNLTSADIAAAAPTASVDCGAYGSVSLSPLLATPFRTWASGPKMVECHYRGELVSGTTTISVWFYVTLFAGGAIRVTTVVENNGYLDNGAGGVATETPLQYTPSVVVNGVTIYTKADMPITNMVPEQDPTLLSEPSYRQTITFSTPHGFSVGDTPLTNGIVGMVQLNGKSVEIASIPDPYSYITIYRGTYNLSGYVSGGTATFGGVTKTIVSITQNRDLTLKYPNNYRAVVTCPSHGYAIGMQPKLKILTGMVEYNGLLTSIISSTDANTFRTAYYNTGGYPSAFVSGASWVQPVHHPKSAWSAISWVGTDPAVVALHDVVYLRASKLVPNYGYTSPSGAKLNSLTRTYTAQSPGDYSVYMPATAYQPQIGLLTEWDALYCASGDERALHSVLVNSRHLQSHAIFRRSKATNELAKPSVFPKWCVQGYLGGASDAVGTGGLTWEMNHHPSGGYLAYLLTGDAIHYDTLSVQASLVYFMCYWSNSAPINSGVNRVIRPEQVRGWAWAIRTLAQYTALAPDGDEFAAEFRSSLQATWEYWASVGPYNPSAGQIGYPRAMSTYDTGAKLTQATWQFHFWMGTNGMAWDIEPGHADTTAQLALRDWMYKGIVGVLGGNGVENFCYTNAARYYLTISDYVQTGNSPTASDLFYNTWGEVWTATFGTTNTSCTDGGVLSGASGDGSTGYWGNLRPAIAYAVDHGAPGAAASFARLSGASNYSAINVTINDQPVWGILPRAPEAIVDGLSGNATLGTIGSAGVFDGFVAPVAGAGESCRVDTTSLIAGACVVGDRGLGVLGSETLTSGPGGYGIMRATVLRDSLQAYEVRAIILTQPAAGKLFVNEDGSLDFSGAPDGSYSYSWKMQVGGVDLGSPVIDYIYVGTPPTLSGNSTLNGMTVSGGLTGGSPSIYPSDVSGNAALESTQVAGGLTTDYSNTSNLSGDVSLISIGATGTIYDGKGVSLNNVIIVLVGDTTTVNSI